MSNPSLSEVCESLGLLSGQQSAAIRAKMTGEDDRAFAEAAVTLGFLNEEGMARALATQFRLNMVPTDRIQKLKVSADVLDLLPRELMRDHMLVPTFLDEEKRVLSLLTADPTDIASLKLAQAASKANRLRLFVAPRGAIQELLERLVPSEADEYTDPRISRPVSLTVVWEPNAEQAGVLRALSAMEAAAVEVASTAEDVEKLLATGRVVRILHRQVLTREVEPLAERWRRQSPALLVGSVPSWGPGSQYAIPYDRAREFFLGLLEFVMMAAERQRMDARSRTRRLFRLSREMAEELGLPVEQRDAVAVAALLTDIDEMSLVGGVVDPTWEGRRFGLALSVLQPLRPPYDFVTLFDTLDRRLSGKEGPGNQPAAEILYTARAAVRVGMQDGQDPVLSFGAEAPRHDAAALRALSTVLRREGLRQQVSTAGGFNNLLVVAERDAGLLTALEGKLTAAGYRVMAVGDGEQALAAARGRPVAAILANFRLPRKDGLSMLMELRRDPKIAEVPVVLLSDSNSAADLARGIELGAEEVMGRPLHLDVLLAKLHRILDRRSSSGEAGIIGRISDLPMVDLLQTLTMGGRTAWLRIITSTEDGIIQVRAGKLVAAELGANWQGEEALYALMDLDEGRFEVHFGDLGRSNLHGATEFLLLEAVRRRDERRG